MTYSNKNKIIIRSRKWYLHNHNARKSDVIQFKIEIPVIKRYPITQILLNGLCPKVTLQNISTFCFILEAGLNLTVELVCYHGLHQMLCCPFWTLRLLSRRSSFFVALFCTCVLEDMGILWQVSPSKQLDIVQTDKHK